MWQWMRRWIAGSNTSVSDALEIDSDMKYLIVGLGNVGAEYDDTRHNVGFEIVDGLAIRLGAKWESDKLAAVCQAKYKGRHITLIKPTTYMNRSGKAVKYWMDKLKLSKDNVLVVVDDLHLEYGKLRMRSKGSDAGHNGLKDIQAVLGGTVYPRLKVGIGSDFRPGQQVDYVLGKWSRKELESLQDITIKAGDMAMSFVAIGISRTMNQSND